MADHRPVGDDGVDAMISFDLREPRRGVAGVPRLQDVVFRFGAAWFAVWVIASAATSPLQDLRPWWWPAYLVLGSLIAVTMLVGAFMTLREYLTSG